MWSKFSTLLISYGEYGKQFTIPTPSSSAISNCKKKEIYLQSINGSTDHFHLLISLGKDQSIAKVVQLIKGESSYWINQSSLFPNKFAWQDDYFAVSVSESHVGVVVNYIKNQEEHHKKKTFSEEVDEFLRRYGFKLIKD